MKNTFLVIVFVVIIVGAVYAHQTTSAISSYSGPWKDGTYTGQAESNEYGSVQVAAVIAGGKITGVNFLQLPSDRGHSAELSSMAQPTLLQETLQAQNANVDGVSGATLTSDGYRQSLQTALALAK
jgi:uncharacterized protein with FMN-binding domain